MKPDEFKFALTSLLVERGVPRETAPAQVMKLFDALSGNSKRIIEDCKDRESLIPIADELADKLLHPKSGANASSGYGGCDESGVEDENAAYGAGGDAYADDDTYGDGADANGVYEVSDVFGADVYYAGDAEFYAHGGYVVDGASGKPQDSVYDADFDDPDYGEDELVPPSEAEFEAASAEPVVEEQEGDTMSTPKAAEFFPSTANVTADEAPTKKTALDGAQTIKIPIDHTQTKKAQSENTQAKKAPSADAQTGMPIEDAPTATIPVAKTAASGERAPQNAAGGAGRASASGSAVTPQNAAQKSTPSSRRRRQSAGDLAASRALTPEEMRRNGLVPKDDIDEYAPDDATLTKMGLSLGSYEADAIEGRDKTKREFLALPPLPKLRETPDGKRSFLITAICLSPVIAVLAAAYFCAWGAVFAAEAALIAALIVALVAVAAGGAFVSLAGIIYGVVKLPSQHSEGLFEIGLGIAVVGATLFAGVLIYNLALRFMPWAIKKTARLCRFVTRKVHIGVLNIRGRFSAK